MDVKNTTTFHQEVDFLTSFQANGFITEGSNLFKGYTQFEGVTLVNDLEVFDSTILHSNILVDGHFVVNDALEITVDNEINLHSSVTVHSNIVLKEEAVFEDGFVAFGSNVLYGSTEIKELNVTENVVLRSDVLIEGNIRLNSNIRIDGDFQSSGDFQVHGHLKVNDSFEITPNSNVLIYDPMDVKNTTTFHQEVDFLTSFQANGFITEGSNLFKGYTQFEGVTLVNDLEVFDSTILHSNILVDGHFVVNDALEITVDNEINLHSSVTVHSNIVLKEEAVFEDGFVAFGSNVLYGSTEIKELNVTDSVVLRSDVLIEGNIRLNDSMVLNNSNININGDTFFNRHVFFDLPFYANGFFSEGSNVLKGHTHVEDTCVMESLEVTNDVVLGSNVRIEGAFYVNGDDFIITESNIQMNTNLLVNSEAIFNSTMNFNSNVIYNDIVQFNSNALFEDIYATGDTILNGSFRVNDDTIRIEGRDIFIQGKVALLDELLDFDFGQSNLFINMESYLNSNVSVLFDETSVFEVLLNETLIHNNLIVQDKLNVNTSNITLSSNIVVDGDLTINNHIFMNKHETIFNSNVNIMNNLYIEENNFILHTSNIDIIGNLSVNDRLLVDKDSSTFKYYDQVLLELTSNLNILTESFFNNDVTISDANFTIKHNGVDVFGIQGSNVYFTPETLERFQTNINLSGKMYGEDRFNNIEVYTDMIFNSNLVVLGSIIGNEDSVLTFDSSAHFKEEVLIEDDLITQSNIYVYPSQPDNNSWWKIFSSPTMDEDTLKLNSNEADLIFRSKNGATMRFHDTFEESIINFTGQHRCTICLDEEDLTTDLIGRIVVSTNNYRDLHNNTTIRINEAIPIVKVAQKRNDKAVFGVIGGIEDDDNTSKFSLGHISFVLNKSVVCKKVMINSVGEGAIWVCNINGSFENGDYITSSILLGFGMRQESDSEKNYTVAKITCDCDFELDSPLYKCEEFIFDGQTFRKAFVGCVYCC